MDNSFDGNYKAVILVKNPGSSLTPSTLGPGAPGLGNAPSSFPVTPPRPGRRPIGINPYNRIPFKFFRQGQGSGPGSGNGARNLMISVLFQKRNNHKTQKLWSMILVQRSQKRNQRINVQLLNKTKLVSMNY
jgi:hypothetical protein